MNESHSAILRKRPSAGDGQGALSRRHLLLGGAAVVSLTLLADGIGPADAYAATHSELQFDAWTTSHTIFDSTFSATIPTASILGFTVRGAALSRAGADVLIEYDIRSQTWTGGKATLVAEGEVQELAVSNSIAGVSGRMTFALPHTKIDVVDVGFPLENVVLYPEENVGPLAGAAISIIPRSHLAPFSVKVVSQQVPAAGLAWGAEVDVTWGRISSIAGGNGSTYAYPRAVRLRSTGPGPVPAGTKVHVLADMNLINRFELEGSQWGEHPGARVLNTNEGEVVLELTRYIEAGTDMSLTFAANVASNPRIDDAITYGRVWVTATPEAKPMQRQTRKESATASSDSGTPLVASATRGRI